MRYTLTAEQAFPAHEELYARDLCKLFIHNQIDKKYYQPRCKLHLGFFNSIDVLIDSTRPRRIVPVKED